MSDLPRWQFRVDVGGTFCDVIARAPTGAASATKLLSSGRLQSVSAGDYPPGFFAGWTLEHDGRTRTVPDSGELPTGGRYALFTGEEAPVLAVRLLTRTPLTQPLPPVDLRLGTTRGTNALLQRSGAMVGLLTTRGFADVLRIGDQSRPRLFDVTVRKPQPLTHAVAETSGRLDAEGRLVEDLDAADLDRALRGLRDAGCETLAIAFVNAYRNPAHEEAAADRAATFGFEAVSVSTRLSRRGKFLPRVETAVLDAYLAPTLRAYVRSIEDGLPGSRVLLMTSAGGLVPPDRFGGAESVLSGPAGGVVGCEAVFRGVFARSPLAPRGDASQATPRTAGGPPDHVQGDFAGAIGFDMGGTSTDVCRVDLRDGVRREYESTKAGVRVATPTLAIETVAAGGGSVCRFDGVKLCVGPQSAGADPGPACYGRGGPLTVTDCNLVLGRLPDFPFPLDAAAARSKLSEVLDAMPDGPKTVKELAAGFLRVANLRMAQAVRRVSVARGHDPAGDVLVTFGGAGGQHACAVAEELGCRAVLVHPYAGLLSAYGIGEAKRTAEAERTVLCDADDLPPATLDEVAAEARASLAEDADVRLTALARYAGTEATLEVEAADIARRFHDAHARTFGAARDRAVEVVSVRAVATARANVEPITAEPAWTLNRSPLAPRGVACGPASGLAAASDSTHAPEQATPRGARRLRGNTPRVISDPFSATVVDDGWAAEVLPTGELLLIRDGTTEAVDTADSATPDPVLLEVYNSRFTGIAEQAGEVLRATSVSANVKERLDFSVALFNGDGRLVVNAPHVPVHLGAMGQTVRHLLAAADMRPGDVLVTNDPSRGGSHLPDVTVVTPVFCDGDDRPAFVVASRAHHAEIGGVVPGSVPPDSRRLSEEGVLIRDFRLFDAGRSREAAFRDLLLSDPHPTRSVVDNLSDVAAQVACNRRAADDLLALVASDGRTRVSAYMGHMRDAAESLTRAAVRDWSGGRPFEATAADRMDDGTPIRVRVSAGGSGDIAFDFAGTGGPVDSNLNANPGIVTAAVLYALRLLIGRSRPDGFDLPLNDGVLSPIEINIPPSILNPFADLASDDPSELPAVVGGNTETSQRVVDVLLQALGLAACSQGTMNNLTFGDATFGYYETIAGGSGATPDGPGADAVQVHMTNTRITDVEVLEHRTPVRLRRFAVRAGSGGRGTHAGGEGVLREIEFLRPLRVSLLTGRRESSPPGLRGGDGQPGRNTLLRADGREEVLPWRCGFDAAPGDALRIETPGGGGWTPQ